MNSKNLAVAVVVNTGDQNSYGVVSNLGKKGIKVISVDSNPKNITFYSKYAAKKISPDVLTDEDKFIRFLEDLGKMLFPKPVLFITGDLHLLRILRHRERIEPFYHIPYADLHILETLVNKVLFYKALKKMHIPHAETYFPVNYDETKKLASKIGYPSIIKAVHSRKFSKEFGNKCLKIKNSNELLQLYEKAYQIDTDLLIQKELLGTERYLVCVYMNKNSTPLAICCYQKVRIFPIDYGNAVVCKTVWQPEAVNICVLVLQKLKFTGLCEGEVQKDGADGKFKLTEINARSTTESRLSEKWGVNMEYLVYRDAVSQLPKVSYKKTDDVIWVDILGDIRAVFSPEGYFSKNKITLKKWIKSLKGKRAYAYFNPVDPIPFIILLFQFFLTFMNKKKIAKKIIGLIAP